jgi:flagellar FliJ protein
MRTLFGTSKMSRSDTVIKSKYLVNEAKRRVQDLERLIRDMEIAAVELDQLIHTEEQRTGIRDHKHRQYSTFAKSAAERRSKLTATIDALQKTLAAAIRERDRAIEDCNRDQAQSLSERESTT